jgi:hypothetical protein
MTQDWPANYRRGLASIKAAIEAALARAGADISASSVFLSGRRFHGLEMPLILEIAAVPYDAPRILVRFTRGEILDSCSGVSREDVKEKIRQYPASYSRYRNNPERSLRPFPSAPATGPAKPGPGESGTG